MSTQQMKDEVDRKWYSLRHDGEVEAKFRTEILHGLSEAEKACAKIHAEQPLTTKLTDIIAAHREVLGECCDFFLTVWHPSSSELLRADAACQMT
jgi:hypothetical protein